MISSNLSKSVRSQKSRSEQQKKDMASLMKKILIKNKIVSMLSHQPRKLMQLARKGNLVYKNMQQHTLLPKLTLTNLYPQIEVLNRKNQQHHAQFQQANKELTCSMMQFQRKFSQTSQQEEGKILNIQTQKCYSHIPQYFFTQPTLKQLQSMLTRSKHQADERAFDLVDYSDEIEYNINQQVAYKMKVFMDFAQFLQALAGLVDISCKKIQTSRARTNIVREIIVQKSTNINILRIKQSNLTGCMHIVEQLKYLLRQQRKVKHMQKSLMSLIHAKGKVSVSDLYQKYCNEHEKIKDFCCKKSLCNYGDIRYYVQKNYQQTFNKSLQDYLCQLTKMDKQKLMDILKPNKAVYVSSPFDNRVLEHGNAEKSHFAFDESVEWEEEFQLTVKRNIETEITNIFEFGLQKCTYSTDSLCTYLKQQLQELQLSVYAILLENQQRQKEDMLDNFVKFALNKPTQSSLQLNIDDKFLNYTHKSQILNKISMVKFVQVVQMLSKKFMDLNVRCFSITNELMRILKPLEIKQPQKEEIICAYLVQMLVICACTANSCLGTFISLREVKQTEIPLADRLIGICEEWQEFFQQAEGKYEFIWRKLTFHLSDHLSTGNVKTRDSRQIRSSFHQLQDFVKHNYRQSNEQLDLSKNQDISEELITKAQMKLKLLNEIVHAKNQKLNFNFYALTRLIINKNLIKVIQNEAWTPISILSSKIQNSVGYLLYGQKFLNRLQSQNDSRNYLSKSLLLDKSNFGFKKKSEETIPADDDFDISTTQKYIKIGDRYFKIVGVTEYILQVIYLLFLYFDKYSFDQEKLTQRKNQKENLPEKSVQVPKLRLTILIDKTLQVVNILTSRIKHYVNNLKDLQKKVKSFAKFLLLIYVQLDLFKTMMCSIINEDNSKRRFPLDMFQKNTEKQLLQLRKISMKQIDECMAQIVKKYNSIGYEKIKESIKKLDFNPKKEIRNPSDTTSEILAYFSKSLQIIQDIIIDKRQFWKFLNCPWIKLYLQKINDQSSQIRKFVLKSNGSNSGRRIEQIQWEDKLDWKAKQLKWLLSAIENQGYTEHIKDINTLENQLKKLTEKL